MSPVRVTWQRTLGRARNLRSTGLFVAGFLSAVGGIFAFSLAAADGGTTGVVALWALAAGKVLPVLAALLAMEAWSDELYSGRSDLLLSAPVATRDLTFGKFAGVWTVMMAAVVLSLALSLGALNFFSDTALAGCTFAKMVLAVFALALQGLLWAAVAVAASAFFRSPAAAAGVSLALMSVLPRGLWLALVRWRPEGAAALGEMPFDAQVADMASGVFPVGMLFGYLLLIAVALLVGGREVELLRYSGAGSLRTRLSTRGVQVLAVVFGVFAVGFLSRLTVSLDLTAGYGDMRFSARTLEILSESRADMNATCFMPRSDARFPAVSHLLRALRREVGAGAGVVLSLDFVDPRWDIGEAERLSRSGVAAPSIVFSRARRRIVLPLTEDFGERVCASAMLQLSLPPQRRNVYWTHGHGEAAFDDYGSFGMSDIARELSRVGYRNAYIDFCGEGSVPADCALVVVAGAKDDFSRAEAGRVDAYLRQGGRLLVLADDAESGGIMSLLPAWGVRPLPPPAAAGPMLSARDVVASTFSEHPIVRPLKGSQVVFDRPLVIRPSAAAEQGKGADRIEFAPLASAGDSVFASAVERGGRAGEDTAIRPMRLVVIGDAGFVMNAQLSSMASANRDFFLNCAAYLSGSQAMTGDGTDGSALTLGMPKSARLAFMATTVLGVPLCVWLLALVVPTVRRRRRG